MKKQLLALGMVAALGVACLTGCACSASSDTTDTANTAQTTDGASQSTDGIKYVDGFYATDANGNDVMLAFYEGSAGDVALIKDASGEAVAQYTVENATLADGTAYLLVTLGNTKIGYYESGSDIFIVDEDGTIYGAARLTEEQADALYAAASK